MSQRQPIGGPPSDTWPCYYQMCTALYFNKFSHEPSISMSKPYTTPLSDQELTSPRFEALWVLGIVFFFKLYFSFFFFFLNFLLNFLLKHLSYFLNFRFLFVFYPKCNTRFPTSGEPSITLAVGGRHHNRLLGSY